MGQVPSVHAHVQVSYPEGAAAALARARFQQTLVNNASSVFSSPAFLQVYGEPQVWLSTFKVLTQHVLYTAESDCCSCLKKTHAM